MIFEEWINCPSIIKTKQMKLAMNTTYARVQMDLNMYINTHRPGLDTHTPSPISEYANQNYL